MKGLAITLLLISPAQADSLERPPRDHDLVGVALDWLQIPYPQSDFCYSTGWKLVNPRGYACDPAYRAGDFFECRVRVEPWRKTLTIKNATAIEPPYWAE